MAKKPVAFPNWRFYLWMSVAYFLFWFFVHSLQYRDTYIERGINNLWRIPYLVLLNYYLFENLIPFIGKKRKSIFYNILIALPIVFLYMMLYSWGLYAWRSLGIWVGIYTSLIVTGETEKLVEDQMAFSMMSVFFFGGIRHIYKYIKLKQAAQQLTIEKQLAELNYLKSQTNPHFLFNTLNNIYSLARDKSDLAPESIMRLSKIVRYMLYETAGDYIAVEREIKNLNDYIELEKLRYDESLRVNFNHNIEDMKQAIPPLLLMPLVENAFKHGVSESRSHAFVDIHLSIIKMQLLYIVKNSTEFAGTETSVKENIGLSNLRRQLELLYKDFDLKLEPGQNQFTATLKINLSSHV